MKFSKTREVTYDHTARSRTWPNRRSHYGYNLSTLDQSRHAGDQGPNLDENKRTVGVIGVVEEKQGKPAIGRAWYFRLPREFDRTGTFRLGVDVQLGFYPDDFRDQGKSVPKNVPEAMPMVLAPDTNYVVRLGTLTIDDPLPNEENLPDWQLFPLLPKIEAIKSDLLELPSATSEARFRTFPADDKVGDGFSFLLGSCRYPGLLWKIKEADRIFGPMQNHFTSGKFGDAARFTMMCGDQIYADELNRLVPILRADTSAEFQARYFAAFGAPNLRYLLRHASTYMILDDHEIEDNWTQDRLGNDGKHQLFNLAIGAYMSYQWSHGPRTWGRLLYYRFDCAGYPFFVLDTRTQRMKNNTNKANDKGASRQPPARLSEYRSSLSWPAQVAARLASRAADHTRQRAEIHRKLQRVCAESNRRTDRGCRRARSRFPSVYVKQRQARPER